MKVCLVTPEFPGVVKGGIGTYVVDLASGLFKLGCNVTVVGVEIHKAPSLNHAWGRSISLASPRGAIRKLIMNKMLNLKRSLFRTPVLWRLSCHLNDMVEASEIRMKSARIRSFLREHSDYDVVELSNYQGLGALLKQRNYKTVVRLSSPAIECSQVGARVNTMEATTCRYADLIIGNSHAIIEKTQRDYGLRFPNVKVIWHGVEERAVPDAVRRKDGVDFAVIGRSEPRKGTDILIQALEIALTKNLNFRVFFVGPQEDELLAPFPWLSEKGSNLLYRFRDHLKCLGKVSDETRDNVLSSSHWTLVPSRFESFGLVTIESMRAGTPFISSINGGLREIASASYTSRIVKENTASAWAEEIENASSAGPSHAERLRKPTRIIFEHKFTSSRMAENTLEAYRELLR